MTIHLKTFIITVQHDWGQLDIALVARNKTVAKKIVMQAEGCPASAIKKVIG
jgi:hypothetical protein